MIKICTSIILSAVLLFPPSAFSFLQNGAGQLEFSRTTNTIQAVKNSISSNENPAFNNYMIPVHDGEQSENSFYLIGTEKDTLSGQKVHEEDFFSTENRKMFGDFLFCEKDYLRAIQEYEKYLEVTNNDTVEFKIPLAYSLMNNYSSAAGKFLAVNQSSIFKDEAALNYYKMLFLEKDYIRLKDDLIHSKVTSSKYANELYGIYYLTYFFTDDPAPPESELLKLIPDSEKIKMKNFLERKQNPAYKSMLKAAVLSALIPGAGKFYVEQYSDGIFAAALTGIFGYLAYSNFHAGHNFRGWVFSGLTLFLYAGNIYGSAAAVQLYNSQIDQDYFEELNSYIKEKNYFFPPEIDFCK